MTPLVFQHNGKDIVVAGAGSEVYLLDSGALGGQDHSTPFARARVEGAVRAAFAAWEDPETRTRWIYVPVSGGADPASGGISAFTLEERDGRLALVPRWTSRGMVAPAAPVIANGLVFALSTGAKSNAKLFVLDAASGKEALHEPRHRDRRRQRRTLDWRLRTARCISARRTTRCTASGFRPSIRNPGIGHRD